MALLQARCRPHGGSWAPSPCCSGWCWTTISSAGPCRSGERLGDPQPGAMSAGHRCPCQRICGAMMLVSCCCPGGPEKMAGLWLQVGGGQRLPAADHPQHRRKRSDWLAAADLVQRHDQPPSHPGVRRCAVAQHDAVHPHLANVECKPMREAFRSAATHAGAVARAQPADGAAAGVLGLPGLPADEVPCFDLCRRTVVRCTLTLWSHAVHVDQSHAWRRCRTSGNCHRVEALHFSYPRCPTVCH